MSRHLNLKRANVKLVINGEAEPRQVQVRIMDGDKCLTEKIQYAKKTDIPSSI